MASNRSKYVLKIAAYAAIALAMILAFLVAGSFVMTPKNNSPKAGMIQPKANGFLGEEAGSLDVLFLGDSLTYSSISPLQLWNEQGFTSYACASPGQALSYSNTLLHRAYEGQNPQHPKLVVIEAQSVYTTLTFSNAISRTIQDLCPLIEYHSRWKSLTLDDFTQQPQATWTHKLKGFRFTFAIGAGNDEDNYMEETSRAARITRVNNWYLENIVNYCREHDATPVIVSVPGTWNWSMARHNGMKNWAAEHDVDFIDFNTGEDKVAIDWKTQTKDGGNHLNYEGAVVFTTELGKVLSQRYALTDHRNDSEYASSWNAAYKKYMKIVNKARKKAENGVGDVGGDDKGDGNADADADDADNADEEGEDAENNEI